MIGAGETLSLDAAAACEAACRAAAGAAWCVLVVGEDRPPPALAWLHPAVSTRAATAGAPHCVPAAFPGAAPGAGEPLPSVRFVGPDGAPLWRRHDYTVDRLRALGVEPEGVRAFVDRAAAEETDAGPLRFLSIEAVERENRTALLALAPEVRLARLADALAPLRLQMGTDSLERAWTAIRPRIRKLCEARELLGFLAPAWRGPGDPEARALRAHLAATGERWGSPAEVVRAMGDGAEAAHRRAIRWALTGQRVAPRLEHVWELLGHLRASARLRGEE